MDDVANSVLLLTCRDVPSEMPVFVAANSAKENGNITPRGDNLFAAVRYTGIDFVWQVFLLCIHKLLHTF